MFIKKWQLMFFCIGPMDLGAGHLTIIVGMGGGNLPTKVAPRAGHLTNFSNARGDARAWN